MAQKAAHTAKVQAAEAQRKEIETAREWEQGSNVRKAQREASSAAQADEIERRRREKAALLAAEEEQATSGGGGGSKSKAKPTKANASKKKGGPTSDLAMLENALQTAADKKVKLQRQELQQKKEREQALLQQKQNKASSSDAGTPLDPLLANTEQLLRGMLDEDVVGRKANVARLEDEGGASGLDAALQVLHVSGGASANKPVKAKALYAEYEERMLPEVKSEYPGLRLTQYKEKVWQLWKKSPENPANQVFEVAVASETG